MAVAVALMLPDYPENPGRTCPLGGMRMDQGVLLSVTMLGVLQLTFLFCAHSRWAAPRLQGWDVRALCCWFLLFATSRAQGFLAWPMLPVRALFETYALIVVASAIPSLLLGGAARVESRTNGCVGRWTHRALVALYLLRVASATTLVLLADRGVPWATGMRYAYAVDGGFVLVLLLLALALHVYPGGEESEADAVRARRGSRLVWMAAVLLVSAQETVLMVAAPSEHSLQKGAVLSAYEYLFLLVAFATCLDASKDPLLAALPTKQGSLLSKLQAVLAIHDVLGSVPFDKPLFFSLRSALAKEDARAVPALLPRSATAASAAAAGFGGPPPPAADGKDSDGESIYGTPTVTGPTAV